MSYVFLDGKIQLQIQLGQVPFGIVLLVGEGHLGTFTNVFILIDFLDFMPLLSHFSLVVFLENPFHPNLEIN